MRTIPEIRDELRKVARELWRRPGCEALGDQVADLADETIRQYGPRHAPRQSTRITPELRRRIRELAHAQPAMTQQQIAAHFNVTAGRVSEALNGFRGDK